MSLDSYAEKSSIYNKTSYYYLIYNSISAQETIAYPLKQGGQVHCINAVNLNALFVNVVAVLLMHFTIFQNVNLLQMREKDKVTKLLFYSLRNSL